MDGPNIAHDNAHSAMRLQYHVWKHLLRKYDYVGFEHYRRLFFIDPIEGADMAVRHLFFYGLRQHFFRDRAAAFAERVFNFFLLQSPRDAKAPNVAVSDIARAPQLRSSAHGTRRSNAAHFQKVFAFFKKQFFAPSWLR